MSFDSFTLIDFSAALPEGYTQRPTQLEDAEAVARVYTRAAQVGGHEEVITPELILRRWQDPNANLATSSQVFLNPQGEIVGEISVGDWHNPTHPEIDWEVQPDAHREAIIRVMIAWGEERGLQALSRCTPEERFAPATGCEADTPDQTLLEALGYQGIRRFYQMLITLQELPVVQPIPEGFTLHTFDYPAELEALVEAQDEMWQDHYGYVKHPLPELVENWRRSISENPSFDASMWYVAHDNETGQIAGIVLCLPRMRTNAHKGYVNVVGVRRAYRKKGLAQAMLTHAFAEFWTRGQQKVGLGVDASSPTGATRLYERVGMSVDRCYIRMEKEMRPGVERMNTGE